jgi:hypothetical protein
MKHKQTRLLDDVIDGILLYLPAVCVLENVPAAATNGQLDLIREHLGCRYHIQHGLYDVASLGGLIVRRRLYILLVRRRYTFPLLPANCILDLLARAGKEPERCVQARPARWMEALALVGNAAHPACTLSAVADLASHLPGHPLQPVNRPVVPPFSLRFRFDASLCSQDNKVSKSRTAMLRKAVSRVFWSAPRAFGGWGAYVNGFTLRGLRDLATQVRYACCTPNHMRLWHISPAWVAWLMGMPSEFGALLGEDEMAL